MAILPGALLIVTPFELSAIGGVSTAVKMLAREFRAEGYSVHIMVAGENRILNHHLVEGLSVFRLYLRMPQDEGESTIRGLFKSLLVTPLTLLQIALLCRREKICAVYIQYPLPHFVYFGLLRRVSRWKLILTFQGSDAHGISRWKGLNRASMRHLFRSADHISAVAKSLLHKVFAAFPFITVPQSVIPNGSAATANARLPISEHSLPADFILSAGHLIHRKGFDVLVRGFAMAHDRVPNLQLLIAGDGIERDSLTELIKDCKLVDFVHLVGWRDHSQMLDLMSRCLFFVLTSRAEGLPLVIAEAMMSGKTVLATAVDGVPDIVDHKITGVLVKPEDADAVAAGICELTLDTDLRIRMERAAKAQATKAFSWKSIAGQYLLVGGVRVESH